MTQEVVSLSWNGQIQEMKARKESVVIQFFLVKEEKSKEEQIGGLTVGSQQIKLEVIFLVSWNAEGKSRFGLN